MGATALAIVIILSLGVLEVDGRRRRAYEETDSLQLTDARFTDLLKEINSTYHNRPLNTANNKEFEKYFRKVLFAINLSIYDLATKIDIYTDFSVYNQIRLELEREMFKKLQVAERLLKFKNLLPKCRKFFSSQIVLLKASFRETNLMKMEILHDPSPECENVEIEKIFVPTTPTPKPRNYDQELHDILQKYRKRPWGNKKYVEFDEQIWKAFMATNQESKRLKREAVDAFLAYDENRDKLDKALAVRIGKFKKRIETETDYDCKSDLIKLNKKLARAMFKTIKEKHTILVATNYVQSCLSNDW
ncbi:uncharacterized protein LOC108031795 [Drosophila biarmipes]|uniref:uncharacterized protein LOC108031795 n=1 Tax=Drosophila biarmipes TaxID=125945 RepID=UPI0007E6AF3D|nr:uncharacterized protein LOC108031795 [Drosophila biarmipes]